MVRMRALRRVARPVIHRTPAGTLAEGSAARAAAPRLGHANVSGRAMSERGRHDGDMDRHEAPSVGASAAAASLAGRSGGAYRRSHSRHPCRHCLSGLTGGCRAAGHTTYRSLGRGHADRRTCPAGARRGRHEDRPTGRRRSVNRRASPRLPLSAFEELGFSPGQTVDDT